VIVGGESSQGGAAGRPFDVAWAEAIREQCAAAGVAFFLKQLGSNPYEMMRQADGRPVRLSLTLADRHGGDPAEWPGPCRRELPRLRPVTA
jgi:hypothetical protein